MYRERSSPHSEEFGAERTIQEMPHEVLGPTEVRLGAKTQ